MALDNSPWRPARIVDHRDSGRGTRIITVVAVDGDPLGYEPGNVIAVRILDPEGDWLRHAYTIMRCREDRSPEDGVNHRERNGGWQHHVIRLALAPGNSGRSAQKRLVRRILKCNAPDFQACGLWWAEYNAGERSGWS